MSWLSGPASADPRAVIKGEFDVLLTELYTPNDPVTSRRASAKRTAH
jgi:hypothetical protein